MTEQIYVGSVFIAGMLSFFSPCILPLLPVYLAYLGSSEPGNEAKGWTFWGITVSPVLILRTLLFILGLSTVFITLGFGAGALGSVLTSSGFIVICGIVVIVFGIYQTGIVKLRFLERERRLSMNPKQQKGLVGAFLLGFTFSFGWTPCIGPVLSAVLSLSASEGSWTQGGWLMLIYTLGLAIPFLILSIFSELLLVRLRKVYKHMKTLKIVSGIILILMGVLLLTNQLNTIAVFFQS